MKAGIDATGKLTVRAENDLEHYALKKWWEDWTHGAATMQVETIRDGDPNALTFHTVHPENGYAPSPKRQPSE